MYRGIRRIQSRPTSLSNNKVEKYCRSAKHTSKISKESKRS